MKPFKALWIVLLLAALLPVQGRAGGVEPCSDIHAPSDEVFLQALRPYVFDGTAWCASGIACHAATNVLCGNVAFNAWRPPTNRMAFLSQAAFDEYRSRVAFYLRSFGSQSGLVPLQCAMLARVAAALTGDEGEQGLDALIELAQRLNRPHQSCSDQVAAALPRTSAIERALSRGNGLCLSTPQLCPHQDPPLPRGRRWASSASEPCDGIIAAPYRLFLGTLRPYMLDGPGWCSGSGLCQASKDVFCASHAYGEWRGPSTDTFFMTERAVAEHRRQIAGYIRMLDRTPLAQARCDVLARVAGAAHGDTDEDEARHVVALLAVRVDQSQPGCAARVRAAFPETEAMQRALAGDSGCYTDPQRCRATLDPSMRRTEGHALGRR